MFTAKIVNGGWEIDRRVSALLSLEGLLAKTACTLLKIPHRISVVSFDSVIAILNSQILGNNRKMRNNHFLFCTAKPREWWTCDFLFVGVT